MTKELEALESIKRKYIQAISKTKFPRFTDYEKNQFELVETVLKEKEQQDSVLKTLKEVIAFGKKLPDIEVDDDGNIQGIFGAVGMRIQRQMENQERELFRNWVLKECFPKELKVLEIIKETPEFAWYVSIYENAYEMVADRKSFRINESVEELQKKFDLLKEFLNEKKTK